MLKSEAYPLCCGANILSNFPTAYGISAEEFKKKLTEDIKAKLDHGLSLAILTEDNYAEIGPILTDCGFKLIKEFNTKPKGLFFGNYMTDQVDVAERACHNKNYLFVYEKYPVDPPKPQQPQGSIPQPANPLRYQGAL